MKGSTSKYTTPAGTTGWRIQWAYRDPASGQRRTTTKRGFKTKGEADAALADILGKVRSKTYRPPSDQTLAEYLNAWLAGVSVKPNTLLDYTQSARKYVIPQLGGLTLEQLQPEHLDGMYGKLERQGKRDGTGLAPKSVRNVHVMLHAALRDAVERGHVPRNVAGLAHPPTAKQAKSKAARDRVWSGEQIRAFLNAAEGECCTRCFT